MKTLVWLFAGILSLSLAGCRPAPSPPPTPAEGPSAEQAQLQGTVEQLRAQLQQANTQAEQLRQQLAACQQRETAAQAAEQQRQQQATQQRQAEEQRVALLQRLASGALTTAELQQLLPAGQADRQRVEQLLGPPDQVLEDSWVYRRGPIQDAVVMHKRYGSFTVRFGPKDQVRDLSFGP